MPDINNVVIARANWDDGVTNFASPWFDRVIERANELRFNTTDLHGDDDTKVNFDSAIQYDDPTFVTGMGHGLIDRFAGQYNELLLVSGENDDLMKDRVVYLLSCLTGAKLGVTIIKKGGIAFLGYKNDYVFCATEIGDIYSQAFADCSNIIPITLILVHLYAFRLAISLMS